MTDEELVKLVKNAPKSLKISENGTMSVDVRDVEKSKGFQRDLERAKQIVEKGYWEDDGTEEYPE